LQDFILDPGVRLLGLQAVASLPESNLLVFEHNCGSSVSILARRLRQYVQVPGPADSPPNLFGSEQCGQHCRKLEDLEACDRECVNATDRKMLLRLLAMKGGQA
jgi:hypothetical protein